MLIYTKIIKIKKKFKLKKYLKYKKSRLSKNYEIRIVRKKFVNKIKTETIKYRIFKQKFKKINKIDYRLNLKKFYFKAKKARLLTAEEIELYRKRIRKYKTKKNKEFKIITNVFPYSTRTKRPPEVRMGKGKSSRITKYVDPIKSGKTLFIYYLKDQKYKKLIKKKEFEVFYNLVFSKLKKKISSSLKSGIYKC